MINIRHAKDKCKDDISLIENYEQAVNDKTQTWVCHHRWEISLDGKNELHSKEDLIRLGMYYKRPYFELIFLTQSEHSKLHNGTIEAIERNRKAQIGIITSDFGKKYFEHYGFGCYFNKKQYKREHGWYRRHGKCSWEK